MKQFFLIAFMSGVFFSCTDNKTKTEDQTTKASDTASTVNTSANPSTEAPMDTETMMKNWKAYATPGPEHQMMAKWNGTWTGKILMWAAPGAPADTSKATAINKMIYDGRYQQSTHIGNMMGMPFEGQSIMGYDNAKKVFQSTWMDNMGTGIMMMEGPWDEATKTLTMTGKMVDPSSGTGKEITLRNVMRIVDDNNQVIEMYCPGPDGKEFKNMEITLTRK